MSIFKKEEKSLVENLNAEKMMREKVERDIELKINQGTARLSDLVAAPYMQFDRDHVAVSGFYCTVLAITGYPKELGGGWMANLIEMGCRSDISFYIHPVKKHLVESYLRRKSAGAIATANINEQKGELPDQQIETFLNDISLLNTMLFEYKEQFYQVSLILTVYGETPEILVNNRRQVIDICKTTGLDVKVLYMQQKEGVESMLPYGQDKVKPFHNLYTSALATGFPFTQSELIVPNGVIHGENYMTGVPIIFDIFNSDYVINHNMVIIGGSGSGKSFTTKVLLGRYAAIKGTKTLIIDPVGTEYIEFSKRLGGQVINLSPNANTIINPFDLAQVTDAMQGRFREDIGSVLQTKMQYIQGLFEIMFHGNMNEFERATVDTVAGLLYSMRGVDPNKPETFHCKMPTMQEFAAICESIAHLPELVKQFKTQGEDSLKPFERFLIKQKSIYNKQIIKAAESLSAKLMQFTQGSMSGMFKGQTNVTMKNRIVVFNVGGMPDTQRDLAMYIVFGEIYNSVLSGGGTKESIIVMDEAWKMLKHGKAAESVQNLIKVGRKMRAATWLLSQELGDFGGEESAGMTAINNASVKLLLRYGIKEKALIQRTFSLSDGNMEWLLGREPGEGLLILDKTQRAYALKVIPTRSEHAMASTTYTDEDSALARDMKQIPVPQIAADFSEVHNDGLELNKVEQLHSRVKAEHGVAPSTDEAQIFEGSPIDILNKLRNMPPETPEA